MRTKSWYVGGDGSGWALDSELATTVRCLPEVFTPIPLFYDSVHCVYWPLLFALPARLLRGKKIIAHMTHDPRVAWENPKFHQAKSIVGLWIARSTDAYDFLLRNGLSVELVPYMVDDRHFKPLSPDHGKLVELAKRCDIPKDKYLIGSFQRDSEGADLSKPKLVKGPDRFVDIVSSLNACSNRVHVVLAGPRRHWIRNELKARGVPFSFVGKLVKGDDTDVNNLSWDEVNLLYNLVDCYIVASRNEGGPLSIIEAISCSTKIVSTHVGHAPDVLSPQCIFDSCQDAVKLLRADIDEGVLDGSIATNSLRLKRHLFPQVQETWRNVYFDTVPGIRAALPDESFPRRGGATAAGRQVWKNLWLKK
ncbi:MAG TPA: hypothetical protein DDW52_26735 [Planctomycetaceae bacterium]|nr:hypothetical protein [Planctomycetaceae bacterium]